MRPLDLTAALLFPKWTFAEGEADVTVMRVIVDGIEDGVATRYAWDLFDTYDAGTGLRSMSRTTAFPAAAMARLVARGDVRLPGVHPPEAIGAEEGMLEAVLSELRSRGVRIEGTVTRG